MGAHDREITEGRQDTIDGGVILRFPGDWVGPLEELVPFGPSADRESSSGAPDFWGEDSAALQDAVEMADAAEFSPEQPRLRRREPLRPERWLLAAAGILAVALFAVAAVLNASPSSAPHVHAVPFAIASIPPLAAAPKVVKQPPARHRAASHPRRHPRPTRPTTSSAPTTATAPTVTTPSPTYHPTAAAPSSAGNSSQGGGAFTLGGP